MTFSTNSMSSTNIAQDESSAQQESTKQVVPNELFIDLVKKNYPMYLRRCYAYVKCTSIAEDAVQEGILAAHLNLSSVRNKKALNAWLYRIIIRKAINLLHKKRRLILLDDEFDDVVSYDKHAFLQAPLWAEISNPEEEILKKEGLQRVKTAVESLDDRYRIPLLLKDFEEYSIREISEILQLSESNTKVRIHRARIKLKTELNDYFFPDYTKNLK